jgi:hypothetical protein
MAMRFQGAIHRHSLNLVAAGDQGERAGIGCKLTWLLDSWPSDYGTNRSEGGAADIPITPIIEKGHSGNDVPAACFFRTRITGSPSSV